MTSDDAKTRVEALRRAELTLEDELDMLRDDLASHRTADAEAELTSALHGGAGRMTGEAATAIAARMATVTAAIGKARAQRLDAVPAVWAADAQALRDQATAKSAEADEHERGTRDLLAQLMEREGVIFTVREGVSKTAYLQAEADALRQRADAIDRRRVVQSGRVEAGSRDELVTAIRAIDPMTMGPTRGDALAWHDSAAAAEVVRRRRLAPGTDAYIAPDAPVAVALVWHNGVVDARESHVIQPPRMAPDWTPPIVVTNGPSRPKPPVETIVVGGRHSAPPITEPAIRWHDLARIG